jgi:type IV secretion system protein VirD4
MEAAGLFAEKGIRLGYYRSPKDRKTWGQVVRYNGDGGLILVAPPRSGKARDVLVGALLEYDQSCIVVDPKGQLAAITAAQRYRMGQRIIILNPFKVWPEILGATFRYNPMALLDPSSPTFGAECRKLAEGLIAKSGNERDSHWTDGARTLVSSVIGHLLVEGDEEDRNLAQMREIIAGPEVMLLDFAKDALKSPHAFIRQGLAEYAIENAPNKAEIAGKISTAREQTFFLSIDTIADNIRGDDFRFGVLKNEPVTVYVILPDEHLDTCGKWFRLVVASALHDLWRGGRGACRVLAILDEFAHIGHLDILEKAAGMAAGHGLQLWPVLQNLTQLKKDYGENWETFIAGSEIRQFFGTRDQTSAKYVSETSGQRTVTTAGQSTQNTKPLEHDQSSDSVGQAGQPLIRPHEISGFGPNESLIFGPRNIVIDALRQPYFHTPELEGLYAPDPQHKADAAPPPAIRPEDVVTFGDTHAASEEKAAQTRAAKRPMFLRLLMWGTSSNPALNALRKAEYVLTLPLRVIGALFAAPFALHNKPLAALLGFAALFGFWEIFDAIAKQPLTGLFESKTKEYQAEVGTMRNAESGEYLSTDVLFSNYRAAKFVVGAEFRALKAGFTDDGTRMAHESRIDYFMRKMSRSLDKENEKAVGYNLATIPAFMDKKAPKYSDPNPAYPEQGELAAAEAKKQREADAEKQRELEAEEAKKQQEAEVRRQIDANNAEDIKGQQDTASRGWWTDPATGLTWMGKDSVEMRVRTQSFGRMGWDASNGYCQNLNVGGHNDWRLPTFNELEAIRNPEPRMNNLGIKGGINIGGVPWSSTKDATSTSSAWAFNFSTGKGMLAATGISTFYSALCVRSDGMITPAAQEDSSMPERLQPQPRETKMKTVRAQ